ncbi:MAG: hypothetical protein LBB74_03120 [Chitinispirillales bacterium]|nr:hypothetical protein [Chitinispirillales bacterium]
MAAIKDYYDNTLKGKKIDVAVKEGIIEVSFENDGRNKSVGWRMSSEKAATFEYLKPLLENATYAYSEANRSDRERDNIPQFHYFVNNANIGGVDIPIKIQIRDLKLSSGLESRCYTHNFINMESDGPGYGVSPKRGNTDSRNARTLPTTDNISDSAPKSKEKIKIFPPPKPPSHSPPAPPPPTAPPACPKSSNRNS